MSGKIKALVVEPMKPCEVREIDGSLETMQAIVGGNVQAVYPFRDEIALICNEEAKLMGLPYNRPLTDNHGLPYDIICGTFFLAGQGGEDFVSLTDEQIGRYKDLYDNMMVLTVEKAPSKQKISEKKKEKHHER